MSVIRTEDEHVRALAAYLPSGRAFAAKGIPGTVTRALLQGFTGELLRADSLVTELRDSIIPDETILFLSEWESALSIPDGCFTGQGTDDERRRDILAKLVSLGVQTSQDFVDLAAQVYSETITVTQVGVDPSAVFPYTFDFPDGEFIFGLSDREARFTIIINFENQPTATLFPYTFPILFGTREVAVLQCLFDKVKPANVQVNYTSSV